MGPEALHPITAVASGQPKGLSGKCQILPDVAWEVASPPSGPVASRAHTPPCSAVCSANPRTEEKRRSGHHRKSTWESNATTQSEAQLVLWTRNPRSHREGHTVILAFYIGLFVFYFYVVVIISLHYE